MYVHTTSIDCLQRNRLPASLEIPQPLASKLTSQESRAGLAPRRDFQTAELLSRLISVLYTCLFVRISFNVFVLFFFSTVTGNRHTHDSL